MNRFTKTMGIILSVIMLTSTFAGCSTKIKEKTTDNVSVKQADVKLPDGKKLTYWSAWLGGVMAKSPADTDYFKTIEAKTGIPLEFISSSGGKDQLAILVASGDIPDIIDEYWVNFPGGINKSLADGLIIPLNDLMDKGYAPNFKAYLNKDKDAAKLAKTDDGKYYSFPMIRLPDSPLVFNGFMIRDDWMKELKLSTPKTVADMENVLLQFKEKKGATAAFSGAWNNYSRLVNAFGVDESFYIGEDGKVKFGFMQPEYKSFLTLFNSWMKKGLVDPDIFTENIDTLYAKVASNKVGVLWGNTGGEFSKIEAMKKDNPKLNFIAIPNPISAEGQKFNVDINAYRVNTVGASISSKCKYPQAAAKVLDYVYGDEGHMLSNFGIEGKSYTMVSGYPTYTDLIKKNPNGYSFSQALEFYDGSNNKSFLVDKRAMDQGYALPQQKDSLKMWAPVDAKIKLMPPLALTSEESQEFAGIMNDLNTYTKEMKMKFILGTEPISNFDSFVSNLKKMKIDRAIEIEQTALDRFNKR